MFRCRSRLFLVAIVLIVAMLGIDVPLASDGTRAAAAVADTTAPTVRIVAPATGATLSTITVLDAQASDVVGVTSVEFRLTGGGFSDYTIGYGTRTIYGWIFRWDLRGCPDGACDQHTFAVPSGPYTLAAVAFDAAGNIGRSAAIAITITSKVHIVTPAEGAVVRESVPVVIDTGGLLDITRVGYVLDLNNFDTATRLPDGRWSATWTTNALSNGTHWLQAFALNSADEWVGISPPVSVVTDNDRTAPTSRIVVPSDLATLSGTTILAATATDYPSSCVYVPECSVGVTSVRFFLSGGRGNLSRRDLGPARLTIYGWLLVWDTTSVPADRYFLTVQATDANVNTAQSSFGIRVQTTGPALPGVSLVPPSTQFVTGTIWLDADAWGSPNVTRVEFRISGNGHVDELIGVGTKTIYGWLCSWNTDPLAGDFSFYEVTAVAYNAIGSTRSPPLTFIVW